MLTAEALRKLRHKKKVCEAVLRDNRTKCPEKTRREIEFCDLCIDAIMTAFGEEEQEDTVRADCFAYRDGVCMLLDDLHCEKGKCGFYKARRKRNAEKEDIKNGQVRDK